MQRLTAAPRDSLTEAQVTSLLTASNLTVTAGCELLASDLTFVEDISDDLVDGRLERNLYATIHGTCDLTLTRALAWGVDLVKPYMTLSDGAVTARFNLGVYALTTPERTVGALPQTYQVQGFDRIMLLNRQIGADYTVTSGTTYRAAIEAVFTAAGLTGLVIDGAAADSTLPADRTWPLVAESTDPDQTDTPVTYLRVVNDLLRGINFRSVYADENGVFRCEAYQSPASAPAEFTFTADDEFLTIVGEDRTVLEDVWATPNRWVFRNTTRPAGSPTATEGDGIYTYDLSDATNGDWLGRKLTWTAVVDYEAATQAKLVELGDRRVAADRRLTSKLRVTTGPWPVAGHGDVYTFADVASGGTRKVLAPRWSFDLSGSDVSWDWEVVS